MKKNINKQILSIALALFSTFSIARESTPSNEVQKKLESNRFIMAIFENNELNKTGPNINNEDDSKVDQLEDFLNFKNINQLMSQLSKNIIRDEDF